MDITKLIELYPNLYHMAECGAWESIRAKGLLSTIAVLDLANLDEQTRFNYETGHRPEKVSIKISDEEEITLRDQKPMPPARLARALQDNISPEQWYKLINSKVFFWTSEIRLTRLLGARHYRNLEHDVLTIDSAPFITAYADRIWLSPMNSGNTWPMPHARGNQTFQRISDYPTKHSSVPVKPVVELVADYSVPNIGDYITTVRRMKGAQVLSSIYNRG